MEPNTKGAATFYQYKLIKKINLTAPLLRVYILLPLLVLVLETVFLSWWSILYLIIAAPVMFWVQYVISRSVLLISGHPISKDGPSHLKSRGLASCQINTLVTAFSVKYSYIIFILVFVLQLSLFFGLHRHLQYP